MDRDIVLYSRKSMNYLSHLASQDISKFFYTHHYKPLTNLFDYLETDSLCCLSVPFYSQPLESLTNSPTDLLI